MAVAFSRTSTTSSELVLQFTDGERNPSKRGSFVASVLGTKAHVTLSHLDPDGLRMDEDEALRTAQFFMRVAADLGAKR